MLLCRDIAGDYYYLPGGHVEFGERATAAAEREYEEESGLRVRATDLLLVTEGCFEQRRWHHEVTLVFHVEPETGPWPESVESRESHLAFDWVPLAAIVDLDVRPLSHKAWLASGGGGSGHAEWASDVPPAG